MISKFTFINHELFWPVLLIVVALWLVFGIKEWFSGSRRSFIINTIIALFALGCLAMIALKPAFLEEKNKNAGILLTENYIQNELDSLKEKNPGLRTYSYAENDDLWESLDSLNQIYLLGSGVASYDFWRLKAKNIAVLGSKSLEGITAFTYEKAPFLGDNWSILGNYRGKAANNKLVLQEPGGEGVDSVLLTEETKQRFEFNIPLKSTGNFVYKLVEKDSIGTAVKEEFIPVVVQPRPKLNILILNDFPTFETKYLKNYLAADGHQLLVRSKLTRGRFKYEYFNRNRQALGPLNEENLSSFDLLLMDNKTLQNLSISAKNGLESAITKEGLGLFIQADATYFSRNKGFFSLPVSRNWKSQTQIAPYKQITINKEAYQFSSSFNVLPVFTTDEILLVAYKRVGRGRVGASVLKNTYQLLLEGHSEVYKHLWAKSLRDLSKRDEKIATWSIKQKFARVDQPLDFTLRTAMENPQVVVNDTSTVALKQNAQINENWSGKLYPKNKGWQQLALATDSSSVYSYYVYGAEDRHTQEQTERYIQNKREFSHYEIKNKTRLHRVVISLWWFYCGFLLCMAILWLAPKIRT